MGIPLWEKPSCPNNVQDYVSVVPLHSSQATQYLAAQRELKQETADLERESSCAASTTAEGASDESSVIDDSSLADESCDECDQVQACFATAEDCTPSLQDMPQFSRTQNL